MGRNFKSSTMTLLTSNGYQIGMVDASEDADACYFFVGTDNKLYANHGQVDTEIIDLPPGSWSILGPGLATQCTEDDAKIVLPNCWLCDGTGVYVDYEFEQVCCMRPTPNGSCCGNGVLEHKPVQVRCANCEATGKEKCSRVASLHSLIRANNMKPETTVIVYKKL